MVTILQKTFGLAIAAASFGLSSTFAAVPPLSANEEIVKTKDGCGFVIDSSSQSAKYQREGFSNLTWGGACIDGLAMGEGIVSSGVTLADKTTLLPATGWLWYGRIFGPIESRWDTGRVSYSFTWDQRTVSYSSLDPAAPAWSKDVKDSPMLNDGETFVTTMSFGEPAVIVNRVAKSSERLPCPGKTTKGCDSLWVRAAGPVLANIQAFLAENQPKAAARREEARLVVARWQATQPAGAAETRQAAAVQAAQAEAARRSQQIKWDSDCWAMDNKATNTYGWQSPRSEGEARLARALKEIYEGPCAKHSNAANGLARANELLRDSAKHKAEEDALRPAQEAYERERAAARARNKESLALLGEVAVAVAGGSNSQERKQAAVDVLSSKTGSDPSGTDSSAAGGTPGLRRGGTLRWPSEGGIEQWAGFSRPTVCMPDRYFIAPLTEKLGAKLGMDLKFTDQKDFYLSRTVKDFIAKPDVLNGMQRELDRQETTIKNAYATAANVAGVSSSPEAPAQIINQIRSLQFPTLKCDNATASSTRDQHFCGAALQLIDATDKIENVIQLACRMGIAAPSYKVVGYSPPARVSPPPTSAPSIPLLRSSDDSSSCGESSGANWSKCLADFCAKEGGTPKVGECVACTGIPGRNWTRCPAGSGGVSSHQ